ncbi:Beta-ketoacyl-[acyl-carrier-protein] synthase III, chloroplastic-like protein [Drosera capensis]
MASGSGLFSASSPSCRSYSSMGLFGPRFRSYGRVLCRATDLDGAHRGVSSGESRVPRLVYQGCKLVGCGSAIPKLQISNDDLAKMVETSDDWIATRTGIRNRRILSGRSLIEGDESLTGLAVEAARKALDMAQVEPDDVDLVLLCTSSPEDLFGGATQVQKALGCRKSPLAYDITAACSGFVLGLVSAACHVRGGGFRNVLVIGADALSRFVDWTDRGVCILFGDAAGAVLVQALNPREDIFKARYCLFIDELILELGNMEFLGLVLLSCNILSERVEGSVSHRVWSSACDSEEDGVFGFDLHSDGEGLRHLNASMRCDETNGPLGTNGSAMGFPPKRAVYSPIQMNGKEVFRFAARTVPLSVETALEKAGISSSSIDWLLLHQANQRIIDAVATRLELPPERVISNIAKYGNTSAASIPLALDEAVRGGKVLPGHIIAASGFGAGLTWGSAIIRWR